MYQYSPVFARRSSIGQAAPTAAPAAAPAQAPAVVQTPATVTTYQGVPGFVETVAVLGVSAAAAYTGIKAGMNKGNNKTNRIAGWVGGVGGALIGLLYLGGKTGVSQQVKLPSVQVVA
jgi:hypothetical protein